MLPRGSKPGRSGAKSTMKAAKTCSEVTATQFNGPNLNEPHLGRVAARP